MTKTKKTVQWTGQAPFPKELKIFVTKFDVEKGKRANCNECPAALALNRRYKPTNGYKWRVGEQCAGIAKSLYTQPAKLQKAIERYDYKGKGNLMPGVYTLNKII